MDISIPCCITSDPGGEGPRGGKKTWGPTGLEDMQGLTLAISKPLVH